MSSSHFHSRGKEDWGVTDGSKEEVQSYFTDGLPQGAPAIDLPKSWRRWATADKEPIDTWTFGRVTILGDAAHPTTQYMAQRCMALEDAVTLGEALRVNNNDIPKALHVSELPDDPHGAIVLSGREMGRIYHAEGDGAENPQFMVAGPSAGTFYDARMAVRLERVELPEPVTKAPSATETTGGTHVRTRTPRGPAARIPAGPDRQQSRRALAEPARRPALRHPEPQDEADDVALCRRAAAPAARRRS